MREWFSKRWTDAYVDHPYPFLPEDVSSRSLTRKKTQSIPLIDLSCLPVHRYVNELVAPDSEGSVGTEWVQQTEPWQTSGYGILGKSVYVLIAPHLFVAVCGNLKWSVESVDCCVPALARHCTGTMTSWSTMIFPRTRYRGRFMVPRGASYFFSSLFLASERNSLIPNSLLTLVRLRWMACPIGYFDAWIRQDSLQVSFQRQYSLDILSKNSYSRTLLNTEASWWLFLHYLHLRPPLSSLLCMLHPQFLRRWPVSMISRSNLYLKSLIDDFEWYVKNASGT